MCLSLQLRGNNSHGGTHVEQIMALGRPRTYSPKQNDEFWQVFQQSREDEMAPWGRGLAAKPNNLSALLGTHMVGRSELWCKFTLGPWVTYKIARKV